MVSPGILTPEFAEIKRGTYSGLVEKIPYLQQLGITAVRNSCRFFNSTRRTPHTDLLITGDTRRYHSLPLIRATAHVKKRSAH